MAAWNIRAVYYPCLVGVIEAVDEPVSDDLVRGCSHFITPWFLLKTDYIAFFISVNIFFDKLKNNLTGF